MNHWEMENVVHLGVTLKEAGFQISQICCSRQSCFDFAARKNDTAVLVKVNSDVDTFSPHCARELKVIAGRVSAASLLISQQTHGKPLEDDTVYSRNRILVITEKTIQNIVLKTANPLVYAGPGGYSVKIDGELVKKRRKALDLSIGKLAVMVGVSRRTIYGYERGMAKASVKSAYKLAKTLGVPIAKPINVFERTRKQRKCLLIRAHHAFIRKMLLKKVLRRFAFCDISPVHRAPFDFILNVQKSKLAIIGSVATRDEIDLEKRIEEITSVCTVIHALPVLITEKPGFAIKDFLCISMDELSQVRIPQDLVATA
ncbi:MAG: helix-turn-helix domain-containing protein [Candidatus Bathyarchaeota archaeon]|nr:helix-turn-helix domain-containing protein [Candidatus Bathyarchaeota archaeon]